MSLIFSFFFHKDALTSGYGVEKAAVSVGRGCTLPVQLLSVNPERGEERERSFFKDQCQMFHA